MTVIDRALRTRSQTSRIQIGSCRFQRRADGSAFIPLGYSAWALKIDSKTSRAVRSNTISGVLWFLQTD